MPLKRRGLGMRESHKPGISSGVDYGLMVVFLFWIAATIGLIILLALRAHAAELFPFP
jgi:hypothetical protein